MVEIDSPPDFVGVWSKSPEDIMEDEDFGAFYIWLTSEDGGFCFDRFGRADIVNLLRDTRMAFSKKYSPRAVSRGASEKEMWYSGVSIDNGETYRGIWRTHDNSEGEFVMESFVNGEFGNVEKALAESSFRLLNNLILDKRREFPYSPLAEALK